jgi:beta-lactamase regulating signal transducer with metallopeptidase domain
MIQALALLGYAAGAAWCAPALLVPLTSRGLSVRAGLAAWLIAMASVLASAALALQFSLATVAADWPQLTKTLCRSIAGDACTPAVYESVFYQAGVAALAIALSAGAAAAAWRYGRRVTRARRQTRAHAEAARIVGRGLSQGTVVLDDPRPAAYCVAGRPAAIVITSGALALLEPPQLRAVLAHERAHLAHAHAALATVTGGLAAAFPGVPLFVRGSAEVERLAEMSADDTAVRSTGRPALAGHRRTGHRRTENRRTGPRRRGPGRRGGPARGDPVRRPCRSRVRRPGPGRADAPPAPPGRRPRGRRGTDGAVRPPRTRPRGPRPPVLITATSARGRHPGRQDSGRLRIPACAQSSTIFMPAGPRADNSNKRGARNPCGAFGASAERRADRRPGKAGT